MNKKNQILLESYIQAVRKDVVESNHKSEIVPDFSNRHLGKVAIPFKDVSNKASWVILKTLIMAGANIHSVDELDKASTRSRLNKFARCSRIIEGLIVVNNETTGFKVGALYYLINDTPDLKDIKHHGGYIWTFNLDDITVGQENGKVHLMKILYPDTFHDFGIHFSKPV